MNAIEYDDDDDEIFHIYENAQWYWDAKTNQLMFKSDVTEAVEDAPIKSGILGSVEFRQDIDLHEQQRFRKRIQRKYGSSDVVTLQDVKDVVLFTAPLKILLPMVVNLLHLPASERLIRALLLYCQYYLQVTDFLKKQHAALEEKIRTQQSDVTEKIHRRNLKCLRLLIGKEYSALITGSGEFAKYHHMGAKKKMRSLSKKDRVIFETFLRILIQIVWIALGRKKYKQIELEVHRIFKSHIFNLAQHNMDRTFEHQADLTQSEEYILNGSCLMNKKKVNTMSPLMDEVHCVRETDYRLYGIGVIKYPCMNARLRYLEDALTLPEKCFKDRNVNLGILGANHNDFDIMLNEISRPAPDIRKSSKMSVSGSRQSTNNQRKSDIAEKRFSIIDLPPEEDIVLLDEFPHETVPCRPCDKIQRAKWLHKVLRKHKNEVKHLIKP